MARPRKKTESLASWQKEAEQVLHGLLRSARRKSDLVRRMPISARKLEWRAEVRLVGSVRMRRLNADWRGKDYATDVLSFEAPPVFQGQGVLGELVICLPVLKRQARELALKPGEELRVLLVHGLLHLLGFDHEKGPRQEQEMRRWEARLLPAKLARSGLIARKS